MSKIQNSMNVDFYKFKSIGVNTDLFYPLTSNTSKPNLYRLKERQIKHIQIDNEKALEQFYIIGNTIGKGGFGTVSSVTEKSSSKIWAMKTVNKSKTGDRMKLVKREIQILKLIQHPHIIYLDRIYESANKIFLILEKCCGQLARIYQEKKPFNEKIARKIMNELVSAVAYLHKYDIVHRDLKLENILIADNPYDPHDKYYIKLSDFGLSTIKSGPGIDNMLHEYCGTLLYMSPEMIQNCSYSQQCDIWSIGVLLYMLVYGYAPFNSYNEKKLLKQICNQEPAYMNANLSNEIIHLLQRLLIKNPANRITAAEMLEHPWMQELSVKHGISTGNILEIMKEWKSEMMTTITKNSETAHYEKFRDKITKIQSKQPMYLPKTDIKFNRKQRPNNKLNDSIYGGEGVGTEKQKPSTNSSKNKILKLNKNSQK